MTSGALTMPPRGTVWRLASVNSVAWPLIILASLLALQFSLIFIKSFNWDEFLHFSMVYQLREGTLTRPFQTLLARLLAWTPSTSDNLLAQMMAARVFVWSAFLIGLGSLYGLARQFLSREDAVWVTVIYLAAGNVFIHGFAIRADPVAMAALMLALYLLASRRIGWTMALAIGALVGFAGLLTLKAVFYAPCFAGIAWLRLAHEGDKRHLLLRFAAILLVAAASFASLYLFHRMDLASVSQSQESGAFLVNASQWLTDGLLRQPAYTLMAIVTAPVFFYALAMAFPLWRSSGEGRDKTIALVSLALPLLTILFYRNVFPYFFVFILAPVAVALAPGVAELRKRHGRIVLAGAISAVPLVMFVAEPRPVLERQRALIGYIHRQFPMGATYFDYSGIIANHPRVIDHLASGIGLRNYRKRGIPLIARAVETGELAFVIDNRYVIGAALAGEAMADGLLPADVAALHGNYVNAWGNLWLAGEEIPAGAKPFAIDVPSAGQYIADGVVTVNGADYRRGEIVQLAAGRHLVKGGRSRRTVLWRGVRLPAAPPNVSTGPLFANF